MSLLKLSGFIFTHDPTLVKENGKYYRFQTGPGLPFFVSEDLHHWKYAGKVFNKNPEWTSKKIPGSTDFWAPEVVYRGKSWRIYYSVSTFGKNTSAIGLVKITSINDLLLEKENACMDCGPVILSSPADDYNAIDPAVFTDEAGQDRLLFGSFWGGLQLIKLNSEGFVMEEEKVKCLASRIPYSSIKSEELNTARFGNPLFEPNPVEGGFIFFHDNYYYLFASHDFCCRGTASSYHIVVGRSKNSEGPFLDMDDIDMLDGGGSLLRDGFSFESWAGPGHNSVFKDEDGKCYMIYHAYDRNNEGRPTLMIEEIIWKDGWPSFS